MPTLAEKLAAIKVKAERARTRQRELSALLDEQNSKRDTRLKCILGTGAISGKLVDECLKYVGEKERTTALTILKEQEDRRRTDTPQDATA